MGDNQQNRNTEEQRDLREAQFVEMAQEITAEQTLVEIQNLSANGSSVELASARLVKKAFAAKNLLLILLDEECPSLVFRKLLGDDGTWLVEDTLQIDPMPADSDAWNQAVIDAACSNLEALENEPHALVVFLPLSSHQTVMGAFLVVDPNDRIQDPFWKTMLETIAALTADALYRSKESMHLKVSNAELEARLWEITNSRNTLRSLFDSIPSSVYIIDRYYTILAINRARSQRAGLIPQDLVGKKCYEALYKRSEPCPDCQVLETLQSAKITNRNKREWIDQEKYYVWDITSFPVNEYSNGPHQAILFEEDVTEKRGLEADLIQSEKLAAIGQLAAGVAHEINNPLAAVIANAQILKREFRDMDPELNETIQLIEMAGMRAAQVVNNLLEIARRDSTYEFETFSLNENILSAVSLVRHELAKRSIQLTLNLAEDLPEIIASRNHLQGVWINLLVNAMDAIDHPEGNITITTEYVDKSFKVTIQDNGHGIPKEHLTRIFEPFYTTKVVGRGTGLGLSLCLRVVKEHDGNLVVDSALNEGTKFYIYLPDIPRTSQQ